MNNLKVHCYSGRVYADRPASFVWQDKKYEVREVEREWLEPGERHFRVRTEDDRRFEVCYIERDDEWWLRELEI